LSKLKGFITSSLSNKALSSPIVNMLDIHFRSGLIPSETIFLMKIFSVQHFSLLNLGYLKFKI
jgi:hypothetical protein